MWLDGKRLTSFSTAKTEALLYFLAATGQFHSRETLAGLLWAEMEEGKARRNLTKSLSVLRRLLSPYLIISTQRVGFDSDIAIDLDVAKLEAAVSANGGASNIFSLYRGEFLAGFFVKDAGAFEDWQIAERERLREGAIGLFEEGMERAISRRVYGRGIEYGRRLLQLDPWRESVHRRLMLLLARQGQHGVALTQYEQCRQILADELGVEPVAETKALFERIRAARNKPSFALPYEATPLVGRERELADVQQRLQEPSCRLLTITGLGGMGKTRLAITAAHQINRDDALLFLNGVAFVSLAGVEAVSAVPLALANVLEVPLTSVSTPKQALINFLRNQEMLLILDNMEHLTETADLLLEILQSCPDIKLLVTSRESLNLAAEWRIELTGLPVPPEGEDEITTLESYGAVTLFSRAAAQVNAHFQVTTENANQVGQLCRLVAGMPLALQLAATWLRTMPISAVLQELERDLDILATDMQDIPLRQRSMRAIFESTWLMLATDEKQAIEGLSICRGGFTQKAAAKIVKINPFLLRRLIHQGLIYQRDETRYDMHALTRQFSQEQLEAGGEMKTAATKHGRFYLTWLIEQKPELHGQTPQITIKAVENDLENVRQARQWAIQTNQLDLSLDSLDTLANFYDLLGLLQEGEALADSALAHLPPPTNIEEEMLLCRALITKCKFVVAQGQYARGTGIIERALELAKQLDDEEAIADIRYLQGRILNDTGNYPDAKHRFKQALSAHRQIGQDWKTIETLIELGWVHFLDGEQEAAFPIVEEALALGQKAKDKRGETNALGVLATVTSTSGNPLKAIHMQKKVITAYQELGDLLNQERSENNIGMTYLGVGKYKDSIPHGQRAVELARQASYLPGLTNALDTLATAYIATGNYKKAKVCLDEALDSALEIGYMYMNYSVRAILIRLFNHTGELAQAQEQLNQLRPLVERLENAQYVARVLVEQAHLTYAQGGLEEASALVSQAIDILRENPSPLDLPFMLLQYAEYLDEQGRADGALPLVEEAVEAAQRFDHLPLQMRGCSLAANLNLSLGEVEEAMEYAGRASLLLPELEPYPDVLTGLLHLGRYRLAVGDNQAALVICELVANHPASAFVVRQQAQALWKQLENGIVTPEAKSLTFGQDFFDAISE